MKKLVLWHYFSFNESSCNFLNSDNTWLTWSIQQERKRKESLVIPFISDVTVDLNYLYPYHYLNAVYGADLNVCCCFCFFFLQNSLKYVERRKGELQNNLKYFSPGLERVLHAFLDLFYYMNKIWPEEMLNLEPPRLNMHKQQSHNHWGFDWADLEPEESSCTRKNLCTIKGYYFLNTSALLQPRFLHLLLWKEKKFDSECEPPKIYYKINKQIIKYASLTQFCSENGEISF